MKRKIILATKIGPASIAPAGFFIYWIQFPDHSFTLRTLRPDPTETTFTATNADEVFLLI